MSLAEVDVDAGKALKRMKKLERELSKETDNAAEEITREGEENARKALIAQGSVATETGINSLDVEKIDQHHYATIGRKYLDYVHEGTSPHTPDVNMRFLVWATQHGWRVSDLVDHIEQEGTRARQWKDAAFDGLIKTAPDRVAAYLRRNVDF